MKEALIVSCSDRKKPFSGPAILVYDGPLHRVLRQNLPRVDLFFLSALHGLIPAHRRIEPYDLRLCQSSLTIPQLGNQWLDLHLNGYVNLYTCMSQDYTLWLAKVTPEYSATETIFRIGQPGMPIGELSTTLKKWCRRKQGEVTEWISLCLNDG